jgi:hypothetical protein
MTDWIANGESGASVRDKLNGSLAAHTLLLAVPISSVELKALFSSPKEIVPAPGAGKFIRLLTWELVYRFGTVAYLNADVPGLNYAGDDTFLHEPGLSFETILSATADSVGYGVGASHRQSGDSSTKFLRTLIENKAIVLLDDQDMTTGDGTAVVTVTYRIVDFS